MTSINQTTFETFKAAFVEARQGTARIAANTSPANELDATSDAYLSEDGLSGFLVSQSGELTSLFSRVPGRGNQLVRTAIHRGATRLDHYAGYLSAFYESHGFCLVGSERNWAGDDHPRIEYRALRG